MPLSTILQRTLLITTISFFFYYSLNHAVFAAEKSAAPEDSISVKQIGMDLAVDIAKETVFACRVDGYNVSVVVVDRAARVMVVLRDTLASHFTIQIAQEKANAVILSGVDSITFRTNRKDIKAEMNEVEGIMVLEGGVKIVANGATLGAVGVSGALGGDKDHACAKAALTKLEERLEFID